MSNTKNYLSKWWSSRLTTIVLAVIVVGCLAAGVVSMMQRRNTRKQGGAAPSLGPIPEPNIQNLEQESQAQIRSAFTQLQKILREPRASAPLLRARAYGEMGKIYHAYAFLEAAAACYRNAQVLQPDEFRWSYYLGHAYRQAGKREPAGENFWRALGLIQLDMSVRSDQGVVALCWLGETYLELNRAAEAKAFFEGALAENPRSAWAMSQLGKLAAAAGDSKGAVQYYTDTLKIAPQASNIRILLAAEYRKIGDRENAGRQRKHAEAALDSILPKNDPLLTEVQNLNRSAFRFRKDGQNALKAKQYRAAAANFRRSLEIDPTFAETWSSLAVALDRLGRREEAMRQWNEALKLKPDSPNIHLQLGVSYLRRGDTGSAQEHFRTALAHNPNPADATYRYWLGASLSRANQFEAALEEFTRAVEIDGTRTLARLGEARMLVALGRYADAIERLELCRQMFTRYTPASNALVRLLVTCPNASLRDGVRGLKLAQELFAARQNLSHAETLAMAFAENGRFDEAVERQRRAIEKVAGLSEPEILARLKATLRLYEKQQPCRVPWTAHDLFPPLDL